MQEDTEQNNKETRNDSDTRRWWEGFGEPQIERTCPFQSFINTLTLITMRQLNRLQEGAASIARSNGNDDDQNRSVFLDMLLCSPCNSRAIRCSVFITITHATDDLDRFCIYMSVVNTIANMIHYIRKEQKPKSCQCVLNQCFVKSWSGHKMN